MSISLHYKEEGESLKSSYQSSGQVTTLALKKMLFFLR